MKKVKKILVPLDGSEFAECVGGWVTGLTDALDAELTLISVIDQDKIRLPNSTAEHGHPIAGSVGRNDRPGFETTGVFASASGMVGGATMTPLHGGAVHHAPAFGSQIIDQAIEQASDYLERVSTQMNEAGLRTSTETLAGDPAEEIIRYANQNNSDLVVMATHRGSSVARGVLGSVTDRVLHSVGIPVMAIHPETRSAFKALVDPPDTIVVPLDGSDRSAGVVDMALDIAKATQAEILFTQVISGRHFGFGGTDAQMINASAGSSIHRHESEEYLSSFAESAKKLGVRSQQVVMTGSPATRLVEEVRSLKNPLIIMSTRGNSGIKRWVFGSVTDKVVRASGVPVIVVPPVLN